MNEEQDGPSNDVAIIGMEARVPGATTLARFWENVRNGVESVTFASKEPPVVKDGVAHVQAAPLLDEVDLFDASFFGFNPREAEVMDPQIRLFLECAWTALEGAGYDSLQYPGRIGVFAGAAGSTYLTSNVMPNFEKLRSGGVLASYGVFNDRDALATLAAYKFDLTGPAVTIQTFCSTSLVAVHLACQSLLNGESDVALAGAASINVSLHRGYLYQEGGILSPDGHTRTFDERAAGTVFGNGVGVVVLKRRADAVADGDVVHAVIKGSAINNDGAQKAGYTAPSVIGQAKAIAEAMAVAGVEPDSISYVEAHGTATAMGDPIEIEALTRAFRTGTDRKQFCAIGSVKTNFGHLDRAAGAAALIKTVLMLKHREIPPTLHFERPNPKIDFASSPFVVARERKAWENDGGPLRAGVSALGVGGTNAHVVLEEAPPRAASGPTRPCQLLLLSARSQTALDAAALRLLQELRRLPPAHLGDAAFTLLAGRRRFEHRRVVVAETAEKAIQALESLDPKRVVSGYSRATDRPVVFLFPGQGSQYAGMTRGLYDAEAVYRKALDTCCERLKGPLGVDLRGLLFPAAGQEETAAARLKETALTQPALFAVEYALARQWSAWGITPSAMIGHSIGEYVAATLAEVLNLEDALDLVAERGRLMQSLASGSMLAVHAPAEAIAAQLPPGVVLAAINAPTLCVVSGGTEAVAAFEQELSRRGTPTTTLHTSHAFHSPMMDPILGAFRDRVAKVALKAPKVPYVSNLSGTWITPEQAQSPQYWADHLRGTVQFSRGAETLLADAERVFLEVGPGNALTTLLRQQGARGANVTVVPSVRHPRETESDLPFLLGALGRLWVSGVKVPASAFFAGERRQRVALPTYPFDRQRYWMDVDAGPARPAARSSAKKDPGEWFYVPTWRSGPALPPATVARSGTWLVFADPEEGADRFVAHLRERGEAVIVVRAGSAFGGTSRDGFVIDPAAPADYERLLNRLGDQGKSVGRIVHAFAGGAPAAGATSAMSVRSDHRLGYYSILYLIKAIAGAGWSQPLQLTAVTRQAQDVLRADTPQAGRATVLGLLKVVPQEHPNVSTAAIDLDTWPDEAQGLVLLESELRSPAPGAVVAHRGGQRFVQGFDPLRLPEPTGRPRLVREGAVVLVTGGLGGVTFCLAAALAQQAKARLVLVGRSAMPERSEWDGWRASRGDHDPVSRRIQRILALEQLGAEVMLARGDVGKVEDMQRVAGEAEARFGTIHAVIHGAGVVGGATFRPLQEIGPQECEEQFHPKVAGLLVLDQVLGDRPLDFCLLTSSLSSVLGGFAYGAYAAGNVFMDAYTHCRNREAASRWLSVNWDEWGFVEKAGDDSRGLARFAMSATEGAGAFLRLLDHPGLSQVVVSTGDLGARIDQWVRLESLHAETAAAPVEKRHPRPGLQTAYVAPSTPAQEMVAALWADLLGIDKVGIQDNFFDLGGHSLLAIQVVTRLKADLKAEVSVATLFEGPTVESLCRLIGPGDDAAPAFDHSSDRGRKRKEERRRRQAEKVEEIS